jgi:hypothetical protein
MISAGWIPTNNNYSSEILFKEKLDNDYYIPGNKKELVNHIINIINNTKQLLCISTYILEEKSIEDAIIKSINERNIDVYIITSHFKFLEEDRKKEQIIDEDIDDEKL